MRGPVNDRPPRDRGTIADPSAGKWRTQQFILIAYLALALIGLVTWGEGFTVLALIAAVLAWAGQWGLTTLTLVFVHTRAGRFFRNSVFMTSAIFIFIVVMAIITVIAFGSDARINGWVILWRIFVTLLITTISARYVALARTLQQEQAAQESLQVIRSESLDAFHHQRQSVIDQVNDQMTQALHSVAINSSAASSQLSQFAREYLRPLSHEILNEEPPTRELSHHNTKRTSFREVAETVSLQPALRPWLMGTAVFWAFLLTTVDTVDQTPIDASQATGPNVLVDAEPFLVSVALLIGIFFVTALSALVLQRSLRKVLPRLALPARLTLLFAAPIVIAVIIETFVQLIYVAPGLAEQISGNLQERLLPAISILVIALIIVLNRTLKQLFTSAEQRARQTTHDLAWELSRLQCTYTREQQFFATQLHGPLQSTLAAAALRISNIDPGTPAWDAALGAVKSDFENTLAQVITGPETPRDVARTIEELKHTWAGVCDIDAVMEDGIVSMLESDWVSSGVVSDILVEACANAAIHGGAKHVHIAMTWHGNDAILITATNDGSTDDNGTPGMGSSMLDRTAMSWSREVVPEGLRLTVELAVPPRDESEVSDVNQHSHA